MDGQHQKRRDKYEEAETKQFHEEEKFKQGSKEIQQSTQSKSSAASPPSLASSPSHEFSFTISLQPSSSAASTTCTTKSTDKIPDRTKSSPASFALDLSPADEIFFHGHLLPLHLLSHLPVSPRSSTNSLDSFTLPIKELYDQDQKSSSNRSIINTITSDHDHVHVHSTNNYVDYETKGRSATKSKSFSLFGLSSKWRKENVNIDAREKEDKERQKRKLKFDHVSHVLKRYMRMVRPLLSFGNRRGGNHLQFHRQAYSYSGNLSLRRKPEFRGRRGEFSAPASMRTSPTNSGLLVATPGTACSTSSDSTMEELQAAIQAAIAHCKNSISMEDKIKCHD